MTKLPLVKLIFVIILKVHIIRDFRLLENAKKFNIYVGKLLHKDLNINKYKIFYKLNLVYLF